MNNSAMRVLEILELFAGSPEPLTISDISRQLGYPKTSVFDIINILCERGFISRDNERAKTYVIGAKAYMVGMAYINRNDLYSVSHPILTKLRDTLGETCYLGVEQGGYVIYLDKVESSQPIRSTCSIGAKNHMYLTGLGKAMLAGMPEEKVREIAERGMEAHTPTTITTVDALLAELSAIRARGCAFDLGEDNSYVRCAAAPIRDSSGQICAAISVSMLDAAFTIAMKETAAKKIIESALEISHSLGYRGMKLY
ncbi:MAG: IclR family transcriptional regulator [Clostridiales bacterium]|nr:IclR family transcriptional regulator [Clostridiales bacterium]